MTSPAFAPTKATGPSTEAGKATSRLNSLKHGLASGTLLLPTEDPAKFAALQTSLRVEHAPATPTEEFLVDNMAKHQWLMDRAIRLQSEAIQNDDSNKLALYLRYQTANHRAFHKSLTTLGLQRKQSTKFDVQFVSKTEKQRKQDLENEVFAMVHGPTTNIDWDQFAAKHDPQGSPEPARNASPPRNQGK